MTELSRIDLIAQLKTEIHNHVDLTTMSDDTFREIAEKLLDEKIQWSKDNSPEAYIELASLNFKEKRFVIDAVYDSIRGLGVLGQLMNDPTVTEIMVNGYQDIFVEKAGVLGKSNLSFESEKQLRIVIDKVVGQAKRQVNESEPIVDFVLADGSRVNAVIPPVGLNGSVVTIRRFSKDTMTVDKLIAYGSITPEVAKVLELLVKARYNIFVSGGTGSGKTTFLNALSNYIPRSDRVITIEDAAELQIKNVDNLVRLQTKNAAGENKGVSIRDLIRSSLRMRPDRVVVGEVRGAEALDMLQAMNTGHDGSLSTGHANSSRDMLARLETMVLQGADGLPLQAIRQQIASAVDIIIHLSRLWDHSRRTVEITEITGYDHINNQVETNCLYKFVETDIVNDKIQGSLMRTENPMIQTSKLQNSKEGRGVVI